MQHEQIEGGKKAYDSATDDGDNLRRQNGSELFDSHSLAEETTRARRGVEGIAGAGQMVGNTGSRARNGATAMGRPNEGWRAKEGQQESSEANTGPRSIDPLTLPNVGIGE